jgi:hypothetical protein
MIGKGKRLRIDKASRTAGTLPAFLSSTHREKAEGLYGSKSARKAKRFR